MMSFTEASYWGPFECLGMGVEALDCFRRGLLVGRGHGTLARWRTMGFAGHLTTFDKFFFYNIMFLLNRFLVVFTIEFY
jgi:hypothetical protein